MMVEGAFQMTAEEQDQKGPQLEGYERDVFEKMKLTE